MKELVKKLEYYFDYYIAYFLYNGMKRDQYNGYMFNKYGSNWETQDHK